MVTVYKPILFSTAMVQAILAGRKSITRRVIKPQPSIDKNGDTVFDYTGISKDFVNVGVTGCEGTLRCIPPCKPGDILWVRETWGFDKNNWLYKADFSDKDIKLLKNITRWLPSIHMPREAARIFLRVTEVRAERVQDISVQDAKDEGIKVHANGCVDGLAFGCYNGDDCVYNVCRQPIEYFKQLWESINARRSYGWDTNCWVWVISFERIERPGD